MEHKHTPGPWAHRNGRIFAADRENLTIAHVARAADGDYSAANGDALAAAPDLLKALQALVELHADWDAGSAYVPVLFYEKNKAAITEARAAIARATGTQP